MNPYLQFFGTTPVAPATARFSLLSLAADPSSQPPRIYHAMRGGGGVVFARPAADRLRTLGYSVSALILSADEARYLTGAHPAQPRQPGEQGWLVTCPGPVHRDSSGQFYCGSPPGLDLVEVQTGKTAPPQNIEPALDYVSKDQITEVRVYKEGAGGAGSLEAAGKFTDLYAKLSRRYRLMAAFVESRGGRPVPRAMQNLLARDQNLLAEAAQPVAVLTRGGSRAQAPFRFGAVALTAGLIYFVGFVAVAVSLAAAAVYCSAKLAEMTALWAANQQQALDLCKLAYADLKSPVSEEHAIASRDILAECDAVVKGAGKGPLGDTDKLVGGAVVVAAFLALASIFARRG